MTPRSEIEARFAEAQSRLNAHRRQLVQAILESPGETFLLEGRRFKMVRGMGSLSAMQDGSADRYFQEGELSSKKMVPEGIEGRVPYRGPVADVLFQMVGGLRSGMGYVGCATIDDLRSDTEFVPG